MSTVTSPDAATAIRNHHAELADGLLERVTALRTVVRQDGPYGPARDRVVAYLDGEIVPHAAAEEKTLYLAADDGPAALLVAAMRTEHRDLLGRVEDLRGAADPVSAVSDASAIAALFLSHLAKENDRLIPALLDMDVSIGELLEGMHELVG